MNELGLTVLGAAARATAVTLVGLLASGILRRRGPSAGALASSTTLAVLVGVTALTLSPWPRWWSPVGVTLPRSARKLVATVRPDLDRPTPESSTAPVQSDGISITPVVWSDFAREFGRELASPTLIARSPAWRWPAWMAGVFLAGLVVALARLGLGLWAVRSLRSRSRPIDDPTLLELVSGLRVEMGLKVPVDLRETSEVETPATIGWRRPALLLPIGWSGWDDRERRAVVAHELAHVLRGDYLAGLAAQVSVSLHFYHPLVHALSRQLRLQQELAADAWGAKLSGGGRPYLTALANLALRQDPRPAAWPARPFLPTRGTFLRRIEMLRDPKALQQPPMPLRGRAVTVVTLVFAGLLVAGFRGPASTGLAIAQEPTLKTKLQTGNEFVKLLDPTMSSSDVHFAIEIRPASIVKNPQFKKFAEQFPADGPKEIAAMISGDIEQVLVLGFDRKSASNPPNSSGPPQLAFIFRAAKPYDWKSFITPKSEEVKSDGFTYFRAGTVAGTTCFRVLDDRTLLMGSESDAKLPPIGEGRPKGRHSWDDAWKKLTPGAVRVAFDTPWLTRQILPPAGSRGQASSHLMILLGPLFDKTQAYAITLDIADRLTLDALANCGTEEGAGRVAETLRACFALSKNALPDLRRMAEGGPPDSVRPLNDLIDAADAMFETLKVEQDKSVAKLHAQSDAGAVATAVRMLMPAVGASREAARRAQCVNNIKQFGLAMHNYASSNDCLPPAVLFGPDGKTPYSWRVALLPYMGRNDLYSQYKFDESWDGPSNRKLISQMPPFYACASDDQAVPSGFTSYFVLAGPATLFPARKEGMKFSEILDGTSNTIMIVEAKRQVPWTKPEDIPYAADGTLPTLGGNHPGGLDAGMGDGSVRFLKDTINPIVLRALLSRAGGEIVSSDSY